MSWHKSYPSREAFDKDMPAYSVGTTSDLATAEESAAVTEQVDAARTAARALIDSGAVGDRDVSVVLSGHANPGHVPLEGYAIGSIGLDFVSLVVNQT